MHGTQRGHFWNSTRNSAFRQLYILEPSDRQVPEVAHAARHRARRPLQEVGRDEDLTNEIGIPNPN